MAESDVVNFEKWIHSPTFWMLIRLNVIQRQNSAKSKYCILFCANQCGWVDSGCLISWWISSAPDWLTNLPWAVYQGENNGMLDLISNDHIKNGDCIKRNWQSEANQYIRYTWIHKSFEMLSFIATLFFASFFFIHNKQTFTKWKFRLEKEEKKDYSKRNKYMDGWCEFIPVFFIHRGLRLKPHSVERIHKVRRVKRMLLHWTECKKEVVYRSN